MFVPLFEGGGFGGGEELEGLGAGFWIYHFRRGGFEDLAREAGEADHAVEWEFGAAGGVVDVDAHPVAGGLNDDVLEIEVACVEAFAFEHGDGAEDSDEFGEAVVAGAGFVNDVGEAGAG